VILALPTMITSFYGMNVRLPYGNNLNAYWGIIVAIFVSIAFLLFALRKKRII
jgi:magnesium transporter